MELFYSFRGEPIINDATHADAEAAGMGHFAELISTGCGAPGAVLKQCSSDFLKIFNEADLVISKGQGNFEALSDTDRKIFFLLKAKCHKIATALNVSTGAYVLKVNQI